MIAAQVLSDIPNAGGPGDKCTLLLPEVPVTDILYLVSFIYCGQVDVPQTHIASFLNTGKHLHVLGLEQGDRVSYLGKWSEIKGDKRG